MIQQKLEKIKSGDTTLYDHLVKVLRQMIMNGDREGFRLFQHYSQKVKAGDQEISCFRGEDYEYLKEYVQKMKLILDKPNTGGDDEPAQPGPTGYVPNLIE